MDATTFFPSRWLRAEDIGNRVVKARIKGLHIEEIGNDTKPVLKLLGFEKGLDLNRTNNKKLIELFGKDTDLWIDKEIELYTVLVPYRGDEVPAIRLRGIQPAEQPNQPVREASLEASQSSFIDEIFKRRGMA